MIYHYFGNKAALYRTVHLKGWQELQVWFSSRLTEQNQADNRLEEAISTFHDFLETHPSFLRLLVWDNLEGGKVSRDLWQDIRGPIFHAMEDLILEAQANGILSKDLKVAHLIVSFMGAMAFYFTHAHTMGDIFQKSPLIPEAIRERKEQILLLLRKISGK